MVCQIERVRRRTRERAVEAEVRVIAEVLNRETHPMLEEIRRRLNDILECLEEIDAENLGESAEVFVELTDHVLKFRTLAAELPLAIEETATDLVFTLETPLAIQYGGTGSSHGLVLGANLGDGNATIHVSEGTWRILPAGTLTGNSVLTLGNTGATNKRFLRVERRDTGAFTYRINDNDGTELVTMPSGERWFADFAWNGNTSLFELGAHGPLSS